MPTTETPTLIIDCTVDLLQKRPIDKISIMEITKAASVSRVTFYNYFNNREDIIDVLVENLLVSFDEIQKKNLPFLELVNLENSADIKDILYPNSLEIMTLFYENQKYVTCLLSDHSGVNFMEILHTTYYNHFLNALPEIFSLKFSEDTITSYAMYMTTGVKAITEEWFLSDFAQSPETITDRILTMLAPALMELYTRKV